jgi:amino acid permease
MRLKSAKWFWLVVGVVLVVVVVVAMVWGKNIASRRVARTKEQATIEGLLLKPHTPQMGVPIIISAFP